MIVPVSVEMNNYTTFYWRYYYNFCLLKDLTIPNLSVQMFCAKFQGHYMMVLYIQCNKCIYEMFTWTNNWIIYWQKDYQPCITRLPKFEIFWRQIYNYIVQNCATNRPSTDCRNSKNVRKIVSNNKFTKVSEDD